MRRSMKLWSKHVYGSLKEKLEEGTSVGMTEPKFEASLLLQVLRERMELDLKRGEDYSYAYTIGSYQNDKFQEVVEWASEVEKFIAEIKPEVEQFLVDGTGDKDNSYGCHKMLLRIREIRAKRDPNLNMRTMAPLSLREKLYCELASLFNICYPLMTVINLVDCYPLNKCIEDIDRQLVNEVRQFIAEIKLRLHEKIPETNCDWYCNKIAEVRTLIDKYEPEFSPRSRDVGSSSTNMPEMEPLSLHEELRCEIRLLGNLQCVDMLVFMSITIVRDSHVRYKYLKEVQELISESDKFVTETKLQLVEKVPGKNSDWYINKIAESRTLTAKRYSAFPLRPQDVGYANESFQIFLSFRGEDTRYSFTRNLYDALHRERFKVFMDDEGLKSGDLISQVLMGAIENSKLSIIVFSENFADSTWCLDEVVKILDCRKKKNQHVCPIFYKVDPSDVRKQTNSYEKALSKQETRFGKDSDMVKNWRSALSEVCGLKAFHYKENSGYEGDFIQQIIKGVKKIRDHI